MYKTFVAFMRWMLIIRYCLVVVEDIDLEDVDET